MSGFICFIEGTNKIPKGDIVCSADRFHFSSLYAKYILLQYDKSKVYFASVLLKFGSVK
jgi:hypothetical protein